MSDPVARLTLELARLPGVGERSAARLAFYLVRNARESKSDRCLARDLASALVETVERTRLCEVCFNFCEGDRCGVCADSRRDSSLICVVEDVADLRAFESSGAYRGMYHVLHGVISPLEGVGPDDIYVADLAKRAANSDVEEVILGTSATVDGDATALFIAQTLVPSGVRVTRLASGIPLGGEIEYTDQATLGRALAQRREFT